jgi:uncharacterized protein
VVRRGTRTITPVTPNEIATRGGLAYSLWLPESPAGGVVILHGAGSCKENHHDFARAAVAAGLAVLAFDLRGHGASQGRMDARVLDDVAAMVELLRDHAVGAGIPVALRGSSMGGYLAILAATGVDVQAVVAICPASAEALRRGLLAGRFDFDADTHALDSFLQVHDLDAAVESLQVPLLLLHAEGDEQVPVEQSREFARRVHTPHSRLIAVRGGHHRSVQHDPELVATSLRWIRRVLTA